VSSDAFLVVTELKGKCGEKKGHYSKGGSLHTVLKKSERARGEEGGGKSIFKNWLRNYNLGRGDKSKTGGKKKSPCTHLGELQGVKKKPPLMASRAPKNSWGLGEK